MASKEKIPKEIKEINLFFGKVLELNNVINIIDAIHNKLKI